MTAKDKARTMAECHTYPIARKIDKVEQRVQGGKCFRGRKSVVLGDCPIFTSYGNCVRSLS